MSSRVCWFEETRRWAILQCQYPRGDTTGCIWKSLGMYHHGVNTEITCRAQGHITSCCKCIRNFKWWRKYTTWSLELLVFLVSDYCHCSCLNLRVSCSMLLLCDWSTCHWRGNNMERGTQNGCLAHKELTGRETMNRHWLLAQTTSWN